MTTMIVRSLVAQTWLRLGYTVHIGRDGKVLHMILATPLSCVYTL